MKILYLLIIGIFLIGSVSALTNLSDSQIYTTGNILSGGHDLTNAFNYFNNLTFYPYSSNPSNYWNSVFALFNKTYADTLYQSTGNYLSGSGTTAYIPLWNGTSSLNNSNIYQLGGNVGIGTTSPLVSLEVDGALESGSIGNGIFRDNQAIAAGAGGGVLFGGKWTGSTYTDWGYIRGSKDTSTDGEFAGSLRLASRNASGFHESLIIASDGNVGIGTTSPQEKLTIGSGNLLLGADVGLGGSLGSIKAAYVADINTYKVAAAIDFIRNEEADGRGGDIYFKTNAVGGAGATTKMVINGAGNVGIGTTTPQALLQLGTNINNNVPASTGLFITGSYSEPLRFGSTNGDPNYGGYISSTFSGSSIMTLGTRDVGSDQPALSIKTGNVGIGTTSPNNKLEVASGNIGINPYQYIQNTGNYPNKIILYDDPSVSGGQGVVQGDMSFVNYFGSGTAGGFNFINGAGSSPITRMRITDSGSVGIGTTSPNAPLEVAGAINSEILRMSYSADTSFHNSFSNYFNGGSIAGDALGINVANGSGTQTEVMRLVGNGKVGIGTMSPGALLDVNGRILASGTNGELTVARRDTNAMAWTWYSSAGEMNLFSQPGGGGLGNVMTIDTSGHVGIGTTNPQNTLNVVGDINITGIAQSIQSGDALCYNTNGVFGYSLTSSCIISSEKFKKNLVQVDSALSGLMNIPVYDYNYNGLTDLNQTQLRTGILAQDVAKQFPNLARYDSNGTLQTYEQSDFVTLLLKGLQEQQKEISNLQGNKNIPIINSGTMPSVSGFTGNKTRLKDVSFLGFSKTYCNDTYENGLLIGGDC